MPHSLSSTGLLCLSSSSASMGGGVGYSVGMGIPMGLGVWVQVCEVLVRVWQSKPSRTIGFLKGLVGFLKRSLNLRYFLLR